MIGEGEWECLDMAVDNGATETVISQDMVSKPRKERPAEGESYTRRRMETQSRICERNTSLHWLLDLRGILVEFAHASISTPAYTNLVNTFAGIDESTSPRC